MSLSVTDTCGVFGYRAAMCGICGTCLGKASQRPALVFWQSVLDDLALIFHGVAVAGLAASLPRDGSDCVIGV